MSNDESTDEITKFLDGISTHMETLLKELHRIEEVVPENLSIDEVQHAITNIVMYLSNCKGDITAIKAWVKMVSGNDSIGDKEKKVIDSGNEIVKAISDNVDYTFHIIQPFIDVYLDQLVEPTEDNEVESYDEACETVIAPYMQLIKKESLSDDEIIVGIKSVYGIAASMISTIDQTSDLSKMSDAPSPQSCKYYAWYCKKILDDLKNRESTTKSSDSESKPN